MTPIRADARDFSERLHVPLDEVRRHPTYDAETDTVEPPSGPIAAGYACREIGRVFEKEIIYPTVAAFERFAQALARAVRR